MRFLPLVFAASIAASFGFSTPALAQPTTTISASDRETARKLMDDGDAAVAKEDYEAALKAYSAAHAIMNVPTTGIELAKVQLKLGLVVEARETALQVARMPTAPRESPAFEAARKEATELAAQASPRVASLQVSITGLPADVVPEVTVDGAVVVAAAVSSPRRVNPGPHKVLVKAPGYLDAVADVTAPEGGSVDVPIAMAPAKPKPPPPVVPKAPTKAKLPVRFADRPLTLPALTLAPALGFRLEHTSAAKVAAATSNFTNIAVGGQIGILDDFQVDVTLISVDMTPKPNYGLFTAGAMYRFLKSPAFEMAGRFQLGVSAQGYVYFAPEVPIRIHAGHVLRIDTGVRFTGIVGHGPARASLSGLEGTPRSTILSTYPGTAGVPFDFVFSVADPFYLGLKTGIGFIDLGGYAGATAPQTFYASLGGLIGATIPSKSGPLLDIQGEFNLPWFLVALDRNPPLTNLWQVGLTARAYIPL